MLSSRKQCLSISRRTFSILRRYFKANRFLFFGLIVMRVCSFYRIYNFFYVIASESLYYERCFRSHLKYKLALPDAKTERFFKEKKTIYFRNRRGLCEDNPLSQIVSNYYKKITRFRQSEKSKYPRA
jgi:hypothetical protein